MRAVLFDLDGTLADTIEDIGHAMNEALAGAGLPPHDIAAYRRFIGDGVEVLAERALPPDRLAHRDDLIAAFRRIYADHLDDHTRPFDGVPELLDALAARAVPAAVLSNKPEAPTRTIMERLFARWSFVAVAGALQGRPRKPDPWRALEVARATGIAPADWLFVGDTAVDMETARAAGMVPLGVAWGFRARDELLQHGAAAILERPLDLLAHLDRAG